MEIKLQIIKLTQLLQNEIYASLESIVNTNSFTANLEGNKKVANLLIDIAKKHGIELDVVYSSKKQRPHLMFGKELQDDYYAIIGHFDTVHPPQSGFDEMIYKDEFIIGPGTNDMKSGVIVALYSLIILHKLHPNKQIPIKLLFNSDEEIGSLDSREIIENEFKNAKAGFVFEPGRIKNHEIVTGRKGICNFHVNVKGKPAHSGIAPWEGENAIVTAADLIKKLHMLNDYEKGLSVGTNEIKGGIATNIVAPNCSFKVDVRYVLEKQGDELIEQICSILKSNLNENIHIEYDVLHKRPPFESTQKSQKLYEEYKKYSNIFNITCNQTSTGGVSDANFLSAMKIPVLDGLGAFGNYSHTQKEYILKQSLIDKINIFVLFFTQYIK